MATGDSHAVAAGLGPVHGALYLSVVITVARHPRTTPATTALAILPVIGGVLALRRLATEERMRNAWAGSRAADPASEDGPAAPTIR